MYNMSTKLTTPSPEDWLQVTIQATSNGSRVLDDSSSHKMVGLTLAKWKTERVRVVMLCRVPKENLTNWLHSSRVSFVSMMADFKQWFDAQQTPPIKGSVTLEQKAFLQMWLKRVQDFTEVWDAAITPPFLRQTVTFVKEYLGQANNEGLVLPYHGLDTVVEKLTSSGGQSAENSGSSTLIMSDSETKRVKRALLNTAVDLFVLDGTMVLADPANQPILYDYSLLTERE
jgi:hypothetical protein